MTSTINSHKARIIGFGVLAALIAACAAGPTPELPDPPAPGTPPIAGRTPPATEPAPSTPAGMVFVPSGNEQIDEWRSDFASRALASGRSQQSVRLILDGLTPMDRWLSPSFNVAGTGIADQAEFAKPIWEYVDDTVSATRKRTGAEKLTQNSALFDALEARYGVDRGVLAGIWGMETSFGGFIGTDDAANVLANMAVEGRRKSFAEGELIALMKLLELGVVERGDLVSGWAGAMGQTQFMPSTFLAHAEDFTGDSKIDVWNDPADALASAANYLAVSGYKTGQPWGIEVSVPPQFDFALADGTRRDMAFWVNKGLVPATAGPFNTAGANSAELWLPAGARGPKYLLFDNFNAFKTYNRADSYALSVGLLADGVTGKPGIVEPWPRDIQPLSVADIKRLQAGLNRLGYDAGPVDGIAGRGTKGALRRFQSDRGFVADGYPTGEMLAYVEGASGG
ncbi:MAG: lytic murein transglycosylase [Pseudomonadota bacterium]